MCFRLLVIAVVGLAVTDNDGDAVDEGPGVGTVGAGIAGVGWSLRRAINESHTIEKFKFETGDSYENLELATGDCSLPGPEDCSLIDSKGCEKLVVLKFSWFLEFANSDCVEFSCKKEFSMLLKRERRTTGAADDGCSEGLEDGIILGNLLGNPLGINDGNRLGS